MNAFADTKTAFRSLTKSVGFASMSVGMLALGIGGTVFMFAVIKGYILSPVPYPQASELIYFERAIDKDSHRLIFTGHDYFDYLERLTSFDSLAGYHTGTISLGGADYPERHDGGFVTANLFETLRVKPLLGRFFTPEDDIPGAEPVVVLGYNLWQQRFVGDKNIIGSQVRINARNATVIGVMPQGFKFPVNQDLWVPMQLDITGLPRGSGSWFFVVGRLKEGNSLESAQAEVTNISTSLQAEFPETNTDIVVKLSQFSDLYVSDNIRAILWISFAAGIFVLLIACANVANLVLTRTVVRRKELAIRTALGASRSGIVSLVLSETFLISALGTGLGIWIASISVTYFSEIITSLGARIPFWVKLTVDWQVVVFASLVTFFATLLAGLGPAWRASRTDVHETIKDGVKGSGGSIGSISKALVIGEIALSCALLVGAGLLIRSVHNLTEVDLGADTSNILTGRILLPGNVYPDKASRANFYQRLESDLRNLPGVENVAVSNSLPGMFTGHEWYTAEGTDTPEGEGQPWAQFVAISPSYFSTIGREIEEGRNVSITDAHDAAPIVVVNRLFAEKVWPNQQVIGKKIRLGNPNENDVWRTVVGISPNINQDDVNDPVGQTIYVPLAQTGRNMGMTVAVKTIGEPTLLANSVRDTVVAIDKDLPVYWLRTLEEWIEMGMLSSRITSTLFSIFAGMAILLAVTGIYAVLSYVANQRTREFGVRRALGASGNNIFVQVLRHGFVQLAIGLIFGFSLAYGFSQYLTSRLFGVTAFDITTYLSVGFVLLFMVVAAGIIPAIRALRVQPMEALRYE